MDTRALAQKIALIWPHLDERARRMLAASEARQLGHGGVSVVSRACGLVARHDHQGDSGTGRAPLAPGRFAGQAEDGAVSVQRSDLPERLEALVEPLARGDPESPLRWTSKSTRSLAAELAARHPVSHEKVAQLLRDLDYSLQSNRKTEEGDDHPDRDAQFRHINERVRRRW